MAPMVGDSPSEFLLNPHWAEACDGNTLPCSALATGCNTWASTRYVLNRPSREGGRLLP